MATNFEPHECVIFVQSTKIGTHENKAIHSNKITPPILSLLFFKRKKSYLKQNHFLSFQFKYLLDMLLLCFATYPN